jgi:hypothetical protein
MQTKYARISRGRVILDLGGLRGVWMRFSIKVGFKMESIFIGKRRRLVETRMPRFEMNFTSSGEIVGPGIDVNGVEVYE